MEDNLTLRVEPQGCVMQPLRIGTRLIISMLYAS
jgi:hypothetical protein